MLTVVEDLTYIIVVSIIIIVSAWVGNQRGGHGLHCSLRGRSRARLHLGGHCTTAWLDAADLQPGLDLCNESQQAIYRFSR